MTKILYLHGFASSSDSTKADLIKSFVKKNTTATKILIPNLDNDIKNAYYQIEEIIKKESPSSIIGSSLGGFYGTYFAEKFNLLCVNINPAIPPLSGFGIHLGENENYATGKKFMIKKDDISFIRSLHHKKINKPENLQIMTQEKLIRKNG